MNYHASERTSSTQNLPALFRSGSRLRFFGMWLGQPTVIAAPIPSGEGLSQAMASQVDRASSGRIIELGGGTGAITAALLDRGIDPERLVVVESNPEFCRLLSSRFPLVRVLRGDALRLRGVLRRHDLWAAGSASAVVSGLPIMPQARGIKHRLMRDCFDLLAGSGVFVQFTYGPSSPIGHAILKAQGLRARRMDFVWNNLPPASVWRVTRRSPSVNATAH
jgi:phosphatidylethanolamine/phosphatidyl-N-methylethanolamine N-methyltransferase